MKPEEIEKIINQAGPHNHKVQFGRNAGGRYTILEKGCPRCAKIEELMRK